MSNLSELYQLISAITVDAYDLQEQITAFHEVFASEVSEPTWATIVGVPVLVLDADIRATGLEMTAHCRHDDDEQEMSFTDLVFPPDTTAAWIHAAYRCFQGLEHFPVSDAPNVRPDWL